LSIGKKPKKVFKTVDFPVPEGPKSRTFSPL